MSMTAENNLFKKFLNRVMVETGTYRGDAIQLALDAGFESIHSIDIVPHTRDFCMNRFNLIDVPDNRITLHTGDSAEMLWGIIKDIDEPITFWLDSHWQMLEGEEPGANPWPLYLELQQIKRHSVKDHTIIIDDMWFLTHPYITGWHKTEVELWLYAINPNYKLQYFANPIINNILVASI